MEEFREIDLWRVTANSLISAKVYLVAAPNLDEAARMARQVLPRVAGQGWSIDQIKHDGKTFFREPQVEF